MQYETTRYTERGARLLLYRTDPSNKFLVHSIASLLGLSNGPQFFTITFTSLDL